MSTQMELNTFYRIVGNKLIKTEHGVPGYPLENQLWEPTAYIDKEDGLPYVSGYFSGDHDTFATNEDFGIKPLATIDGALTFQPTLASVEALLPKNKFSAHSYLYLTEVHDESSDLPITSLYHLSRVSV